jgi:predicted outer membrane repeat protein
VGSRVSPLLLAATLLVTAPSAAVTIRVDWAGSGDYETIQEGLDAASAGDTVLVLPGTYTGSGNRNLDFRGLGIVLLGESGASGTTIDCEEVDRAFLFDDGEGPDAVVEGFTVLDGATGRGGAVRIDSSSPTMRACVFRDCTSTGDGGAILADQGAPAFDSCVFEDNSAEDRGGAVYLLRSPATFTGCSFARNSADYGGAFYGRLPAVPAFEDCTFLGNASSRTGGAVRLYGCSPTFSNCRFEDNRPDRGGVVYGEYSSPVFSYCTFWDNRAGYTSEGGRDIHLYHTDIWDAVIESCTFSGWGIGTQGDYLLYFEDCAPRVERSIIGFFNRGPAMQCEGAGTPTVTNCVIYGNEGGDVPCGDHYDNLFDDPLICNIYEDDLALCLNSPCLPANNPWGVLIGAHDLGCGSCLSPVERVSWGQIKALYR